MHENIQIQKYNEFTVISTNARIFKSSRFSVAPMLDWTDRHCRYFHRLLSKEALLYTEMVTTGAIIHGKGDYLAYNEQEHPLALQLGAVILKHWRSVPRSRRKGVTMKSI
ncbi:tRNA dihydrouridine synthase DusA [Xenorhabdus ishibashii]|uniref:tRNA dihydrouridine synthase DusA n=1 Tax=Xenorhabdus ishibashii TaxID=1034471 RepID=A0A2D0KI15_9GAMM|nr:tRNA dihydrouridine synthase DusA [Xenorhabdus ishibashii]